MRTSLGLLPLGTAAGRFVFITFAALALSVSTGRVVAGPMSAPITSGLSVAPVVAAHVVLAAALPIGGVFFTPLLAQSSPETAIERFLAFMSKLFLVIGCIVIAFGSFELGRGRVMEGLLSVAAGFVLAIAIPLMKWLLTLGS